jgi:hypothetical protein
VANKKIEDNSHVIMGVVHRNPPPITCQVEESELQIDEYAQLCQDTQ